MPFRLDRWAWQTEREGCEPNAKGTINSGTQSETMGRKKRVGRTKQASHAPQKKFAIQDAQGFA